MDTTPRRARAILRLASNPFPSSVPPPTIEMFRRIADHLPGPLRPILGPVLKNTDKLKPLLARALVAAGNESAAMTRTTTVVTTLSGSPANRSEEHTSELQSLMRISYAVFCLKKKT